MEILVNEFEVARLLSVSSRQLQKLIAKGLPCVDLFKDQKRGHRLFDLEDVRAWVESQKAYRETEKPPIDQLDATEPARMAIYDSCRRSRIQSAIAKKVFRHLIDERKRYTRTEAMAIANSFWPHAFDWSQISLTDKQRKSVEASLRKQPRSY